MRPAPPIRAAVASVRASAPLTLDQNGSSSLRWVLVLFLAVAVALATAAIVPAARLPQPVADVLTDRRAEIGLAGMAIAVGVGLSVLLLLLLA